ncbi:MAG: autotransporter-associated beta strand repeat-containing protein, partial [Verrucomicrobiota bacterium]
MTFSPPVSVRRRRRMPANARSVRLSGASDVRRFRGASRFLEQLDKQGPLPLAVFRCFPALSRAVTMLVLVAFAASSAPAFAVSLYWDTNGTAAGSNDSTSGIWGSSNFWNTDSTGGAGGAFQSTTTSADDLFFSAASNATGNNTITISGSQSASSLTFRNGTVTLAGASSPMLTLGTGGITLNNTLDGALTLSTSLTNIVLSGSQTWTNNSNYGMSVGSGVSLVGNASAGGTYNLTFAGAGTGTTTFGGAIGDGTGGGSISLTKSGSGTLVLSKANTYTGATVVSSGTLSVNTGGVITSSTAAASQILVGNGSGRAVMSINGGNVYAYSTNLNAGSVQQAALAVGTSSGTGVLILNSGSVATSNSYLTIGQSASGTSGFGALLMNGGTLTTRSNLLIGGSATGMGSTSRGELVMTGGTINAVGGNVQVGWWQSASTLNVVSMSGGFFNNTGGSFYIGNIGSGVFDLSGGAATTNGGLYLGNQSTSSGIVNLRGGTFSAAIVSRPVTTSTGIINFNGGSLRATASSNSYMQGLTGAYIYSGGGTIDTNNRDVTIAQPLLAPSGSGLLSIAVSGGSAYLAPPIVTITGGGGVGATAAATIDANGLLQGITVTNPGTGYTSSPTVTLVGGGGAGASVGAILRRPNTSGGLTKIGSGTLTLAGSATYTGAVNVLGGTLNVGHNLAFGGGGSVNFGTGTSLTYAPSTDSQLTIGGTLNIDGGTGSLLTLPLGASTTSAAIMVTGSATIANAPLRIDLAAFPGALPITGTYTLIHGGAGSSLNPATSPTIGNVYNMTNFSLGPLVFTSTDVTVDVTATSGLTNAYWRGALTSSPNSWSLSNGYLSNWVTSLGGGTQSLVPSAGTYVTISDSTITTAPTATALGSDMSIAGLQIADTSYGLVLNSDGFDLSIGTLGVTMNAGVPTSLLGSGIVLNGSQTWTTNSSNALTASGVVSGTGGLYKAGTGVLNLTGADTYTGPTYINEGTLSLGATAFSNYRSNTLVNSGATLELNPSSSSPRMTSFSSYTISGSGTVTKLGTGTMYLGTNNGATLHTVISLSPSGWIDIQAGQLRSDWGGTGSYQSNQGNLKIASGSILDLWSESGTFNSINGAGTLRQGWNNTATVTIGSGNFSGGFSGTITDTDPGNGVGQGTLNVVKSGTGTQVLSGTNIYRGNTTVRGGTLVVSGSGIGTRLNVTSGNSFTYAALNDGSLSISGTFTMTGGTGATLGASLGSTTTSAQINVAGSAILSNNPLRIDLYGVPGVTVPTGTFTLLHGGTGSSLNPATAPTLGNVYNLTNFTVGAFSRTATDLMVAITGTTGLTSAYWKGGLSGFTNVWAASNGSSASNWVSSLGGGSQALTPGPNALVTISNSTWYMAPTATVLGANMAIGGLNIADTTNGLGLNADGYALSVGTSGITLAASVPASSIASDLILSGSQSWTNNSGNLLNFNGGKVDTGGYLLTVAGAGNTTISGPITNTGSLTMGGLGTLTLSGANSYTGITTINSGSLVISGDPAISNFKSNITVNSGGTLEFSTGANTTVRNNITVSGTGTVVKSGTGIYYVGASGVHTYFSMGTSGLIDVQGGMLQTNNTANPGSFGPTNFARLNVASGAIVDLYSESGYFGALTGAGTVRQGYTNSVTLNIGSGGQSGVFSGTLTKTAGTFNLTKTGTGTQVLSGSSTYNGSTRVDGGTLQLGSATAIPAATTLNMDLTGTLDLNGYNATIVGLGANLASTALITDNSMTAGTTTLTMTLQGGTFNNLISDGVNGRKVAVALANNNSGTVIFNNGSNTFSGGLTLTDNLTTTYGTRIWASTLTSAGTAGNITSSNFGKGVITVGTSTADRVQIGFTTANQTLLNDIVVNSNVGTDLLGTFRLNATGIVLGGTITANLDDVWFRPSTTASGTLTGRVTGSHGLILGDTSTMTLTLQNATAAPNDYAGNTTVYGSTTLRLGAADQIPNGVGTGTLSLTGTLNLNGFNETINGVSGLGTIDGTSGTPTLTIGDGDATTSFDGLIRNAAGNLSLVKTGSGMLTLGGSNTYTGSTTVSAGTLVVNGTSKATSTIVNGGELIIGGSSAIGTGNVTVASGAKFTYGALTNGTLNISGNFTFAGGAGSYFGGLIGSSPAGSQINVTGNATISNTAHQINLGAVPGVTISTGTYTLIHGGAGSSLNPATAPTLGNVFNMTNFTVDGFLRTATDLKIMLSATAGLTNAYWRGGLSGASNVWAASQSGSQSNWVGSLAGGAQGLTPGTNTLVIFSDSTINTAPTSTVLGADMSIQGIMISDGSYGLGLIADGNQLTIGGSGIIMSNGVPASSLGTKIILGTAQIWTNDSASALSVSGNINNAGYGLTLGGSGNMTLTGIVSGTGSLTKSGVGQVTSSVVNTLTGGVIVSGGTLVFDNTGRSNSTSSIPSSSDMTISSGTVKLIGDIYGGYYSTTAGTVTLNSGGVLRNDRSIWNTDMLYNVAFSGGTLTSGTGSVNSNSANWYIYGALAASGTEISTISSNIIKATGTALAVDVASGGTLLISGKVINASSRGVTKTGLGTLVLSGSNTDAGILTISGGTVQVGDGNSDGLISSFASISNSGELLFNNKNALTYSKVISGAGGVSKSGSGNFTLTGTQTYAGVTRVNSGSLSIGSGTVDGSLPITSSVVNNGTLLFNVLSVSEAGALSGTGAFIKNGVGSLTLWGLGSYTGQTTVNGGNLLYSGTYTTGDITVNSGASLNYAARSDNPLNIAGNLTFGGGNGTYLGAALGSTLTSAQINVTGSAVISGAAPAINIYGIPGVPVTTGTYTLIHGGAGSSLFPSVSPSIGHIYNQTDFLITGISGTATDVFLGVTPATPLTVAYWRGGMSGASTVWSASDGMTNSNWVSTLGGTIQALVPGSGAMVIFSDSTIVEAPLGTVLGENMSVAGLTIADTSNGLSVSSDGKTLTIGTLGITMNSLVPSSSLASGVVLAGSQTWANDSMNTLTISGNVTNGGYTLTGSGGGTIVVSGGISGSGGVVVNGGSGVLTLSGSNSYTGSTTLTSGTINLGSNYAMGGGGSIVFAGGTLQFSSGNTTDYTSRFVATAGPVALDTNGQNFTLSGSLGASIIGGLLKLGSGTLTLSASNAYTGNTVVGGGVLKVGVNGTGASTPIGVASGSLSVLSGATFDVNGKTFTTKPDTIYLSGSGYDGLGAIQNTGGSLVNNSAWTNLILSGSASIGTTSRLDIYNNTFLGGTYTLTKEGTGSTYWSPVAGATVGDIVINGGIFGLQGTANNLGSTAYSVTINPAGQFNLYNAQNQAKPVIMNGGTLYSDINGNTLTGAVTLNSGTTNTINVATSALVLSGTVQGAGGFTKLGTFNLTLSGSNTFTGAATLAAGTIILGNTNALSGPSGLTFAGGTLQFGVASGVYPSLISNSGTAVILVNNNTFEGTLSGDIDSTNTGGLTKLSTGTLTLSGSNGYTGTTLISAGTLRLGSSNALAGGGSVTFGGGTLQFGTSGATYTNAISGSGGAATVVLDSFANSNTLSGNIYSNNTGGLTKNGSGTVTLSGSNGYTGVTSLRSGTLGLGGSNALAGGGSISFFGGTLQFGTVAATYSNMIANSAASVLLVDSNGFDGTLSGSLVASNSGGFTKLGAGMLTLSGSNGYTGITKIDAGTLSVGTSNALAGGGSIRFGGGTLQFTSSNTTDYSARITSSTLGAIAIDTNNLGVTFAGNLLSSNTGGLAKIGSGTLTLSGSNGYTGTTNVNAGTLNLMSAFALGGGGSITFGGGTLRFNTANTTDYSTKIVNSVLGAITVDTNSQGVIFAGSLAVSNAAGLTKLGAGTLTLSGSNSYTGVTTISAGTLNLGNSNALAGGGSVTFVAGTLQFGVNGGTYSNMVANSGTAVMLIDTNTKDGTLSGDIVGSNSGGLTKFGQGTLILAGSNSYTGTTNILSGSLRLSNSNAIAGAGSLQFSGGTLQLGVSGGTYVNLIANSAASILNIDTNSNVGTLSGNLVASNSGGLTKFGQGTLILAGSNSYTGVTSINAGTLNFGSLYSVGGGGSLKFGGGTLQLAVNGGTYGNMVANSAASVIHVDSNGVDGTLSGNLVGSNSGGLTKYGVGKLTLSGSNSYTGVTTISAGTLTLGSVNALAGAGSVTFTGGTLQFGAGGGVFGSTIANSTTAIAIDTNTYHSTISGNLAASNIGGLTKLGAGTLTLSGSNAFTGLSIINAGTLNLGSANALAGGGSVTFAGGMVQFGTNGATYMNAITGSGAAAVVIDTNLQNGTWSGAMDNTNTGGFTKGGSGVLTLSGNNDYTGTTSVNGGTINLGHTNALSSSGAITFAGGTLKFTSSNTTDYSARIISSGSAIALDTNSQNVSFVNDLVASNVGGLIKWGSGMLTLGGSNGYTGTTYINGGTLSLAHTNALAGNGNITFRGGTLQFSSSNTGDYSSRIVNSIGAMALDTNSQDVSFASALSASNTSGLTKLGAGRLILSGSNGYTGTTTISAGTIQIGSTTALAGGGSLTFAGGLLQLGLDAGTFTSAIVNSTSAIAIDTNGYSATISGNLAASNISGLTKLGGGTLVLSGSNAYTGTTTINGGTLQLASLNAFAGGGSLTFTGGMLQLGVNVGTLSSVIANSTSSMAIDTNGYNVAI